MRVQSVETHARLDPSSPSISDQTDTVLCLEQIPSCSLSDVMQQEFHAVAERLECVTSVHSSLFAFIAVTRFKTCVGI